MCVLGHMPGVSFGCCSLGTLSPLGFQSLSLVWNSPTRLCGLAIQEAPRIHQSSFLPRTQITNLPLPGPGWLLLFCCCCGCCCCCCFLSQVRGIEPGSLCLQGKHFTEPSFSSHITFLIQSLVLGVSSCFLFFALPGISTLVSYLKFPRKV